MGTNKKKAVLCYSGGLDSTVLLYLLREEGYDVHCLGVNYGQKHSRELFSSINIADKFSLTTQFLNLQLLRGILKGSSQTDPSIEVPEGHYTDETMKATIVPNRNMILLSLATAWAVSLHADRVAYAAHTGDHAIYPDCRPEFMMAMKFAINLCDEYPPELYTPFAKRTKADIVRLGYDLGVPFEMTYSCYKGNEKHCGKCGTCYERREAFVLANVDDPTIYEHGSPEGNDPDMLTLRSEG